MKLSENFLEDEFICKCGKCGLKEVVPKLVEKLQKLRDKVGQPIHIVSGRRCEKHNKAVGGVKNSYHLKGMAADITCRWLTPEELRGYADDPELFHHGGIGLYKGFLHVDVRGHRARW